MTDLNSVTLIGRLTSDCNLAYTQGGMAINSFSIAVKRTRQSQNGKIDEVSYFEIKLFGKIAETLKPYLVKGKQIAVNGSLVQSRWEQDGQKRSKVEIIADNVQMLGSSNNQESQGQYQAPQGQYQGQPQGQYQGQGYQAPPQAPQNPQGQYQGNYQGQPQGQYQGQGYQAPQGQGGFPDDIPF